MLQVSSFAIPSLLPLVHHKLLSQPVTVNGFSGSLSTNQGFTERLLGARYQGWHRSLRPQLLHMIDDAIHAVADRIAARQRSRHSM
jgi:hypothetical protein